MRRFGEFAYAVKTWSVERRVIARVEASPRGSDGRFIVTNLKGAPRWLYESVYCARGQAENLIKAHKLHLASDRTSCTSATANQFRLLLHTAYWLMHTLRDLAPKTSFWRGEGIGLLEIGLGCSLEVDEPTRSSPWRRDYQHRSGPGKSCGT